jgi:hypothetical protein
MNIQRNRTPEQSNNLRKVGTIVNFGILHVFSKYVLWDFANLIGFGGNLVQVPLLLLQI